MKIKPTLISEAFQKELIELIDQLCNEREDKLKKEEINEIAKEIIIYMNETIDKKIQTAMLKYIKMIHDSLLFELKFNSEMFDEMEKENDENIDKEEEDDINENMILKELEKFNEGDNLDLFKEISKNMQGYFNFLDNDKVIDQEEISDADNS